VFRAGSAAAEGGALRWSPAWRGRRRKIELSNGRYMSVREQLSAGADGDRHRQTPARSRSWCFADDKRSMGLVVDEIIDIVEERLNIEARARRRHPGLGRDQGQATEVIDVGHFLPMAFADWFTRKEMTPSQSSHRCCWSTTPRSFRTCCAGV